MRPFLKWKLKSVLDKEPRRQCEVQNISKFKTVMKETLSDAKLLCPEGKLSHQGLLQSCSTLWALDRDAIEVFKPLFRRSGSQQCYCYNHCCQICAGVRRFRVVLKSHLQSPAWICSYCIALLAGGSTHRYSLIQSLFALLGFE